MVYVHQVRVRQADHAGLWGQFSVAGEKLLKILSDPSFAELERNRLKRVYFFITGLTPLQRNKSSWGSTFEAGNNSNAALPQTREDQHCWKH